MYRDSQHGLTIDLSGPDGNAFCLMGYATDFCRQMSIDSKPILNGMKSGDYNHLVEVFEEMVSGDGLARICDFLGITRAEPSPIPVHAGQAQVEQHGVQLVRRLGADIADLGRSHIRPPHPDG